MQNVDWFSIGIYIVLVIAGWFSIYGAVYNFEDTPFWDFSVRYGKQLVWMGCALLIAVVLLSLDNRVYSIFAYVIYAISIISLIVTLIVAPDIKGSRSWLVLGPVSIQPAEFAKTATCLALAKLMSSYGFRLGNPSDALKLALLFALPPLLIILQQESRKQWKLLLKVSTIKLWVLSFLNSIHTERPLVMVSIVRGLSLSY